LSLQTALYFLDLDTSVPVVHSTYCYLCEICLLRSAFTWFVAYTTFYILGLLCSMQVPFVGMQPIRTSEHMASAGNVCTSDIHTGMFCDILIIFTLFILFAFYVTEWIV